MPNTSQSKGNKGKNKQMGLHQTKKHLHNQTEAETWIHETNYQLSEGKILGGTG